MARQALIQPRRGTAAAWTAANPVLAAGEPGWESDTNQLKFGDGVTAWNALTYFAAGGGPPSGAAGGVLAGTYPNPDLNTAVAGNGLGIAANVLSVNVDGTTIQITGDTLSLKDTAVTPGTYGDSSNVGQFVVDAQGRITAATNISITGSGSVAAADGWVDDTAETWTYASGSTFTVTGDVTAKYSPGTRIKLTQTTVKYFYVVTSSVAAGTTTVTITGGTDYTLANAAIGGNYHSYQVYPQGFPAHFNYTVNWGGFSVNPSIGLAVFTIIGNICHVNIRLSSAGTSNSTTTTFTAPVNVGFTSGDGQYFPLLGQNAGSLLTNPCLGSMRGVNNNSVDAYPNWQFGNWTNSGSKYVQGAFHYLFA